MEQFETVTLLVTKDGQEVPRALVTGFGITKQTNDAGLVMYTQISKGNQELTVRLDDGTTYQTSIEVNNSTIQVELVNSKKSQLIPEARIVAKKTASDTAPLFVGVFTTISIMFAIAFMVLQAKLKTIPGPVRWLINTTLITVVLVVGIFIVASLNGTSDKLFSLIPGSSNARASTIGVIEPPRELAAAFTGKNIDVSWSQPANASSTAGYVMKWGPTQNKILPSTLITSDTYSKITEISIGTSYRIEVSSIDESGEISQPARIIVDTGITTAN